MVSLPGKNTEDQTVWRAIFLKDAPTSTVLAVSSKIYLINEKSGAPKVTLISNKGNNKGTYQFLDSENGKPGLRKDIYRGDHSTDSSGFLSGGKFLLINSEAILDINTLKIHHIDLTSLEALSKLKNYNPLNSPAVGLSPGKTQIVMVGSRTNRESSVPEYALIVVDFYKNKFYAVPFDRTEIHFDNLKDATNQWIITHFDWKINNEGMEILRLRKFNKPPSWKSRWGEYAIVNN